MKKQYITPEMSVHPMPSSTLLAGSLPANGQQDPTMAPEFDELGILPSEFTQLYEF